MRKRTRGLLLLVLGAALLLGAAAMYLTQLYRDKLAGETSAALVRVLQSGQCTVRTEHGQNRFHNCGCLFVVFGRNTLSGVRPPDFRYFSLLYHRTTDNSSCRKLLSRPFPPEKKKSGARQGSRIDPADGRMNFQPCSSR